MRDALETSHTLSNIKEAKFVAERLQQDFDTAASIETWGKSALVICKKPVRSSIIARLRIEYINFCGEEWQRRKREEQALIQKIGYVCGEHRRTRDEHPQKEHKAVSEFLSRPRIRSTDCNYDEWREQD